MKNTLPLHSSALGLATLLLGVFGAYASTAATPVWIPLKPPRMYALAAVYDSRRDRELIVTPQEVWAVSRDPIPRWTRLSGSAMTGTDVVYDSNHDCLWSFTTGLSGPVGSPGVLYSMDLSQDSPEWVQRSYAGVSPGSLYGHAMTYDPTRNRVVLFGGLDRNVSPKQDVYLLGLDGTPTWSTPVIAGTKPTPRSGSSAIYDPFRDRVLVFGGSTYPFAPSAVDEVWSISMSSLSWTFLEPRSPNPPARTGHAALLDSIGQRMIVLGGSGSDTWAMDLSTSAPADSAYWAQLSPGTPLPPASGIAWLERPTRRILRYGAQLWALASAAGSNWSLLADSLNAPLLNGPIAMVDGVHAIWSMGLGGADRVWTRPFDTDQPWQITGSVGPGVRYAARAVADPPNERALVFGGSNAPGLIGQEFADLWAWSPATSTWSPLAPAGVPTPRADALMLYDSLRDRVLVHGGRYTLASKTRTRADTWAYDVAAGSWALLAAGNFGGRWNEAGIYDPVRDRMIAFGGVDTLSSFTDVHVLEGSGGTWTTLVTSGTPPASVAGAAYDPAGDRMLVFANNDSVVAVHALSLGPAPTWSLLQSDHDSPRRRDFALMAEPAGPRILITGGDQDEGWVLDLRGSATPVLVSLVSANATTDQVRIVWQLTPGAVAIVPERRTRDEGWSALAPVLPDADKRVVVEDHDVAPGNSYEYRLTFVIGGSATATAPVTIFVPIHDAFRLDGSVQNPASGPLRVRFSTASDPTAKLELLDLSGRRVISRSVGSLGPGAHLLTLPESERLPAGLYFLQLRGAGETRTARVTLLR